MNQLFKNSYKAQKREILSLSVYNVGFQRCEPYHQWGVGIRDHYLIHYVVSGKGYYRIRSQTFCLETGDIFLIYPNTEVTYYADQNDPWEYYWVGFAGNDAPYLLASCGFTASEPVLLRCARGEEIRKQLYSIYQARGNTLADAAGMTGQLYLLFSLLIPGESVQIQKSPEQIYIEKSIGYIASHYSYPITIQEIADYIGISRSHLFRIFQHYLDISPKAYLSHYRLKQACRLLKESNLSITAIATSVGYDNSLYFSKAFRGYKGMPPSQYRKERSKQSPVSEKQAPL